jgi:hypothetical protein
MNLTLGKRIASGIMLILMLMTIVGAFSYISLNRVLKIVDQYKDFNTIQGLAASMKEKTDSYLLANYSGEIEVEGKAAEEVLISIDNGSIVIGKMIKQFETDGDGILEKLVSAQKMIDQYRPVFNAYIAEEPKKAVIKAEINTAHQKIMSMIKKGLWMEDIDVAGKILFAGYKAYTNRPSSENWASLQNDLTALIKNIDKWFTVIENVEKLRTLAGQFRGEHDVIKANLVKYHEKEAQQKNSQISDG